MNFEQYPVSTEDCMILLAIQNSTSLRQAAQSLNCDPAGLFRKVQRISSQHDLLRKTNGKWTLTETGVTVARWTRESIQSQKNILQAKSILRIGATAWLTEQVLIPQSRKLRSMISASPHQSGFEFLAANCEFESAILKGELDFAITCSPPENPLIAHKQLGDEPWVVIVSKDLLKKKTFNLDDLQEIPFIAHHEINPDLVTNGSRNLMQMGWIRADNLTSIRAAVVHGLGWSFVPLASIQQELQQGRLLTLKTETKMPEKVCLWWLRDNQLNKTKTTVLSQWLQEIYPR